MDLNDRLLEYWKSQGALPNFGLGESRIAEFESKYHATSPSDLRAFLLRFNGTRDMCDRDFFRFLPLEEYQTWDVSAISSDEGFMASHETHSDDFFVFADFLQWCYGYAINLRGSSERSEIVLVGGVTAPVVAGSFTDFIELYLADSPRLHDGVA